MPHHTSLRLFEVYFANFKTLVTFQDELLPILAILNSETKLQPSVYRTGLKQFVLPAILVLSFVLKLFLRWKCNYLCLSVHQYNADCNSNLCKSDILNGEETLVRVAISSLKFLNSLYSYSERLLIET